MPKNKLTTIMSNMTEEIQKVMKQLMEDPEMLKKMKSMSEDEITMMLKSKSNKKDSTVDIIDVMEQSEEWLTTKFEEDADGFLAGQAIVTNIGVFTYRLQDGTILRELRPPEEVFKPESLETLKMVPITNTHPKDLVNIDNIKDLSIGITGSTIVTDPYAVSAPIKITDKNSIQEIKDKKKMAWSCGYKADLDYTSGIWLGQMYDAIQRNIRYNHVALVQAGRAGDLARVRMDNAESNVHLKYNDSYKKDNQKEDKGMPDNFKTIQLDGVDYQAEAEVIKSLNILKSDSDKLKTDKAQLEKDLDTLKADKSKLEAERDTFKDQLETSKKEIEKLQSTQLDEGKIQEAIKERLSILDTARKAGVEIKEDSSMRDIKIEVIKKVTPTANFDGKDDIYVQTRYDMAVEVLAQQIQNTVKQIVDPAKTTAQKQDTTTQLDSYQSYVDSLKNAYKREDK